MVIDKEVVKYIAQLARIELDEEELEYYSGQLGRIITYIEKINEIDLTGLEASFNPHSQVNVYREDKVEAFKNREGLISILPAREGDLIKIPKVID